MINLYPKLESRDNYRNNEFYKKSISLINDFCNVFLDGKPERLTTFCFDKLEGNIKFGIPEIMKNDNNWSFDCDDTALARSIYCVLWGYIFDLNEEDIGTGKDYRGDTINSFNTVLGSGKNGIFAHRAQLYNLDCDIKRWKNALSFNWVYHTLGNFILLPNLAKINTKRASSSLKDYFDSFLIEISNYRNNRSYNGSLQKIQQNKFYFSPNAMQLLKKEFFLKYYFDEREKPIQYFNIVPKERRRKYFTPENYTKLFDEYISKSEKVIEYRAKKMIDIIKEELLIYNRNL